MILTEEKRPISLVVRHYIENPENTLKLMMQTHSGINLIHTAFTTQLSCVNFKNVCDMI